MKRAISKSTCSRFRPGDRIQVSAGGGPARALGKNAIDPPSITLILNWKGTP
jgi:hypothetical protein